MALPDLIPMAPKVIICGTAVTKTSKAADAYYANAGNSLYETLHVTRITTTRITPQKYRSLADFGVGFTDLVKGKTGLDKDLQETDFDVAAFRNKMIDAKPKVVCFNGKKAAAIYLGLKKTKDVNYGLQQARIGNTLIFVAPSTGAQARKYWNVDYWHQLKNLL